MTRTTRILGLTLALAVSPLAISGAFAADKIKIGLAVANLQADFFNQIKQSVEKNAAAQGIEVITVDAKGDGATQVSQIQDLITQGIDALIYIPAGATAAAVPVKAAKAAGIPVINIDRNADGAPGDTFIATDSVTSAKQVCDYIVKKAGGKGNMVIIHGQKGTTPEVDRSKGCGEVIAANPKSAADFQAGKVAALNFLKGQVMKASKGKANPAMVGEILERKLRA